MSESYLGMERRIQSAFHDAAQYRSLLKTFYQLFDRINCVSLVSAALAGTAVTVPSTGAAWAGLADGVLVSIATSTAMPVLVGTVATSTVNVFAFYVDSSGVVTSAMGTAGATAAAVVFPPIPEGKTVLGYLTVAPDTGANFVGGTSNLNKANTHVSFVNVVGAFDPTSAVQVGNN